MSTKSVLNHFLTTLIFILAIRFLYAQAQPAARGGGSFMSEGFLIVIALAILLIALIIFIRLSSDKLKTLFIIGFLINIILTFIPSTRIKTGGYLGIGGEEKLVSTHKMIQLAFRRNPSIALLLVVVFAFFVAVVILAITHPKRWVFLSGAIVVAFFMLVNLFSPSQEELGVKGLIIPNIIGFIGNILCLTGFFIKPKKEIETEKVEETKKDKETEEKTEAEMAAEIEKKKIANAKREEAQRKEYEEYKKKRDDDFLKY